MLVPTFTASSDMDLTATADPSGAKWIFSPSVKLLAGETYFADAGGRLFRLIARAEPEVIELPPADAPPAKD